MKQCVFVLSQDFTVLLVIISSADPAVLYGARRADVRCKRLLNTLLHYITYSTGRRTACKRRLLIFSSECAQSDLQKTFLKYPHSFTAGYTFEFDHKASEEDCLQWCHNVLKCRSAVYAVGPNVCFLQNVTVLDIPSDSWFTTARINNHYQAMCA